VIESWLDPVPEALFVEKMLAGGLNHVLACLSVLQALLADRALSLIGEL